MAGDGEPLQVGHAVVEGVGDVVTLSTSTVTPIDVLECLAHTPGAFSNRAADGAPFFWEGGPSF